MAFGISGVKYKNTKSATFGMFEVAYRYNIREKFKAGGDLSYLRTEDKFEKSKRLEPSWSWVLDIKELLRQGLIINFKERFNK
ncbi:hypothetical protein [Flavobacterium lipolyticum]|uniref:Outer membrane protein beta-barrel domain-containing protein n=1 Tax=Flavobacterium lipolyticum TaxID=2893754 RepID=A0ABS8M4W9_9FLAO|nr:hypothetical protein [Flavobacterium sp. F-126]MCC9019859.1 hypothetical protein [Flavobacterium sp. F-126]